MATKPTIANARWATDGGAEIDAPLSGDRDSGFVTGTDIVADHHNYLLNQLYKWAQYVDEGILTGALHLNSAITPSAITGTNNNYDPTGWSSGTGGAQEIRQDLSAAATLTGLAGGATGRLAIIRNLNATYDLKLAHDVTSTAANRFQLPEGKDLYLVGAQSFAVLKYDATLSRWVCIATNGRQPKTLWLHGAHFDMSDDTDAYAMGEDGLLNTSGSAAAMYGSLPLPVGTRLTEVMFSLTTGAVDSFHSGRLEYADPAAGGNSVLIGSGSTTVENSDETFTLSDMPHTMLDFPYVLSMSSIQNGDMLIGVKVTYY